MGVQGLWQILEPASTPVDVHSLKGKVLAVDASIWLHQLVKGFRDKDGNPVPNAHLLGVFYRVCKLLSYGIKPVFVFDGGVPILKRQTLEARRSRKLVAMDKSEISRQKLLSNFIRQQLQRETKKVVPSIREMEEEDAMELESGSNSVSGSPNKCKPSSPTKRVKDRFEDVDLELQQFREKFAKSTEMDVDRVDKSRFKVDVKDMDSSDLEEEDSDDEDERNRRYGMDYDENFSAIVSNDFDVLPLETQHEILSEMQESKKMNSWGKMQKMPNDLQDFSSYQMDRLVKRRFLQKKIQSVQQEMGQKHLHVQNLDELLKLDYNFDDEVVGSQDKGFVLLKKSPHKKGGRSPLNDSQEARSPEDQKIGSGFEMKKGEQICDKLVEMNSNSDSEDNVVVAAVPKNKALKSIPDLEEERQIEMAIQLSLLESGCSTRITIIPEIDVIKEDDIDDKSIEVKNDAVAESESTFAQTKSSFILPSTSASCSKFLDVVGFSARAISSASKPSETSSDNSDDDFEAVQEPSEGVDDDYNEQNMVKGLLKNTVFEEVYDSSTPTVATINIADIVCKVPNEDDDIFADVFEHRKNKSSLSPSPINNKSFVDPEPKIYSEWGTDWESDPDVEFIEKLESTTASASKRSKSYEIPIEQRKQKHIGPKTVTDNQQSGRAGNLPEQSSSGVTMITTQFMQAQQRLNIEQHQLRSEKGFHERVATSISDQISVETQELLGLFGIPYIVSPMEAESQCAFLDAACLTDGTISDDSDCWLFGSLRVYKNFYATGNKPIEFYQLADITRHLNLDREKLVLLAMLSGGDYSDGIEGVGPVTALEIIAEFPTNEIVAFDTLLKFREWWDLVNQPDIQVTDLPKIRQKLRKLKLRPGFPNEMVYQAYMNPSIDTSTEAFRWGNPDLEAIRAYVDNKFGWNQAKADSMLLPVVKNLKCQIDKSKQPTLDSFLVSSRYDLDKPFKRKRGSKRLHKAFKKLKQSTPVEELALSSESTSEDEQQPPAKTKPSTQCSKKEESQTASLEQINANLRRKKSDDCNIPQKVQHETNQIIAKQKAIEIFKSKNSKK